MADGSAQEGKANTQGVEPGKSLVVTEGKPKGLTEDNLAKALAAGSHSAKDPDQSFRLIESLQRDSPLPKAQVETPKDDDFKHVEDDKQLVVAPDSNDLVKPAPEQPSQELATPQPRPDLPDLAPAGLANAPETVDPNSPEAKLAQAKIDLDAARTKYVKAGHGFAGKIAKMWGSPATKEATANYNKALKDFQEASFVKLEADIADPAMNDKITENGNSRAEALAEATMRGLSIGEFVALQDEELKVKEQKLANSKIPGYKNIIDKYSKARKFVTETVSNKLFGTDADTHWGKKMAAAGAVGFGVNAIAGFMSGGLIPAGLRILGTAATAEGFRSSAEEMAKKMREKSGEKKVQAGLENAIKEDGTVDMSKIRAWADNETNNMDSKFQNLSKARIGRGFAALGAAAGISFLGSKAGEYVKDNTQGFFKPAEVNPIHSIDQPDSQDILKPHLEEKYTVKPGDTLTKILEKDFLPQVGGEDLKHSQQENIVQNLLYPDKSFDHDTAQKVRDILEKAGIHNPNDIKPGQEIKLNEIYDAVSKDDKLKLLLDHAKGLNADKIAENIKADHHAPQATEASGHDAQDQEPQRQNAEYLDKIYENVAEDKYHTAERAQKNLAGLKNALQALLGPDYANSPQYDKLKDIPVEDILAGKIPFNLVDSMPGEARTDVHKLQGYVHQMVDAQSTVIPENKIMDRNVDLGTLLVGNDEIIRKGPLEMDSLGNITGHHSPHVEPQGNALPKKTADNMLKWADNDAHRQEPPPVKHQMDAPNTDHAPIQTTRGDGSPPRGTPPGEISQTRGYTPDSSRPHYADSDTTRHQDTGGLTPEEAKTRDAINKRTLKHVQTLHDQDLDQKEKMQKLIANEQEKEIRRAINEEVSARRKIEWAQQSTQREWDNHLRRYDRTFANNVDRIVIKGINNIFGRK